MDSVAFSSCLHVDSSSKRAVRHHDVRIANVFTIEAQIDVTLTQWANVKQRNRKYNETTVNETTSSF